MLNFIQATRWVKGNGGWNGLYGPSQYGRPPGQACTKGDEKHMIAFFYQVIPIGFVQCNGYCRRRGVSISMDIGKYLLHGNSQDLCQALNDSDIGLVRNYQSNIAAG